jgi:energy-coupling factor transporter ATP-binding protein EcfA2
MIETFNLTKKYDDKAVVNNLNMKVEAGEIFGFLGPNGAGKTTTMKMLLGLVHPSSGTGKVAGHHPGFPAGHRWWHRHDACHAAVNNQTDDSRRSQCICTFASRGQRRQSCNPTHCTGEGRFAGSLITTCTDSKKQYRHCATTVITGNTKHQAFTGCQQSITATGTGGEQRQHTAQTIFNDGAERTNSSE